MLSDEEIIIQMGKLQRHVTPSRCIGKKGKARQGDSSDVPGAAACLFRSSISLIRLSFPEATTVVCSAGVGCSGVSATWTGTGAVSSTGDGVGGNRTDAAAIEARSAFDLFFRALPRDADIGALERGGAGAATGVAVAGVTSGRLTATAAATAAAGGATAAAGGAAAAGIVGAASAGGAGVALVTCAALAAAAVAAPTAAVFAALADARATSEAARRCDRRDKIQLRPQCSKR
jgi:hypothetical protein